MSGLQLLAVLYALGLGVVCVGMAMLVFRDVRVGPQPTGRHPDGWIDVPTDVGCWHRRLRFVGRRETPIRVDSFRLRVGDGGDLRWSIPATNWWCEFGWADRWLYQYRWVGPRAWRRP